MSSSSSSSVSGTRVLRIDPSHPDPSALEEAAGILRRGGLVAFATETVYGLGAIATDAASVARIYTAKGRPAVNPLIVHVSGVEQARSCVVDWPEVADTLAERFWPGPLTFVLKRSAIVPEIVAAGGPTVALRAPAGAIARGLIERAGAPIAAPSANRSNRLSPTRAEHVLADLDGLIDLVLDSGPTPLGLESTVLDLTAQPPRLLRPGPLSALEMEGALAGPVEARAAGTASERPASPGQMLVHYAPQTPAFRVDSIAELGRAAAGQELGNIAVVACGAWPEALLLPIAPGRQHHLGSPTTAARLLYDVLHRCDARGHSAIIVVMPPDLPEWAAVRDRLLRATRPLSERGTI